MVASIRPEQLWQLCQQSPDLELIDVRTPVEFRAVHVPGARNVPLDQLAAAAWRMPERSVEKPLYVICHSGARSQQACQKLISLGCSCVVNVEGGTKAWETAGLPVERGAAAFSLDRQVRVVIGAAVVMGALLALATDARWIGLSALMGAGLIYAGVTDRCPLACMIARMPWNRTAPADQSACRICP